MVRHRRIGTASIERIRLKIDYGTSDLQAIANAELKIVDPRIDEIEFGLFDPFPLGPIKIWANLVTFSGPRFLPPVDAFYHLRSEMGLRPGTPFELHHVGSQHRYQQIIRPIVVEDVAISIKAGRPHVQCLTRTPDYERSLTVLPADLVREDDYRYLAFDRFWS